MPKKVNKPRLTPNQSEWLREYKQLDSIIKRTKKKYPDIEIPEPPKKPQRITEKSLTKLSKYKEELDTKISTPKTPKATTLKTPKATTPKTPKATTPKTPKATSPKTPKDKTPKTPKATTPKTPKSTTPKTPKAKTPKVTEQLPKETEFIDNEILNYIDKAINTVKTNYSLTFRTDRIHSLESIKYLINNPLDITIEEMYQNIHNNILRIKEIIDYITYDSKQDMVDYMLAELFDIILQRPLTLEESSNITEATEKW